MSSMIKKYWGFASLVGIVLVFCIVRWPTLWYHDVAYTYDQARDFLAGARMVTDRHLAFIGPTTGIGGLFHGVWWYYVTAFSFFVLGGEPIRFYLLLLVIHLLSLLGFYIVVKRVFGTIYALLGSLLVASATYFARTQVFAGNNILAAPAFLAYMSMWLLIIHSFEHHKRIPPRLLLALGLATGFVAEFELAFGIYLVPLTLLMVIALVFWRTITIPTALKYGLGLIPPFLPRALFEVKNGFLQTKVLLGFLTNQKVYTPRPFANIWSERIDTYWYYLKDLFGGVTGMYIALSIVILGVVVALLLMVRRPSQVHIHSSIYTLTIAFIMVALFALSLTYKDTFWDYYFEGIQYGFILLVIAALRSIIHFFPRVKTLLITSITLALVLFAGNQVVHALTYVPGPTGLKVQEAIVNHIIRVQKKEGKRIFCVRVYVPPVIPYTYDYLWLHHYLQKTVETPRQEYIDGTCWYIIEPEPPLFQFRLDDWKEKNIPSNATSNEGETIQVYGIEISRYHLTE